MLINSRILLILTILFSLLSYGQISNFKKKFNLPNSVKETSGLLFLNGKIITHNDSGNDTKLFEIDSLSGQLLRTISINNVRNIDWEDITEDENNIYIGDFGNNEGNRTDLKIYKILKSEYLNSNTVSAEEISFFYEDQSDFNEPEFHDFDAEAFVVYDDSFLIFTKNRGNFRTNVYKVPITTGQHTAIKVSAANVKGLITGATLLDDNFMLCGYNTNLVPFLIYVSANRNFGDDIFNNGFSKYSLENELGAGNQVEGITRFDNGRFYISREEVNKSPVTLKQALFEFTDEQDFLLSVNENNIDDFNIYPNPAQNKIYFSNAKKITQISFFNTLNKKVLEINAHRNEIDISNLLKGIYIIKVQFVNQKSAYKKVIKM